jgi:hypothetical protein
MSTTASFLRKFLIHKMVTIYHLHGKEKQGKDIPVTVRGGP